MAELKTHHERMMHHLKHATTLLATQARENQIAMASALEAHNKMSDDLLTKEGVADGG